MRTYLPKKCLYFLSDEPLEWEIFDLSNFIKDFYLKDFSLINISEPPSFQEFFISQSLVFYFKFKQNFHWFIWKQRLKLHKRFFSFFEKKLRPFILELLLDSLLSSFSRQNHFQIFSLKIQWRLLLSLFLKKFDLHTDKKPFKLKKICDSKSTNLIKLFS